MLAAEEGKALRRNSLNSGWSLQKRLWMKLVIHRCRDSQCASHPATGTDLGRAPWRRPTPAVAVGCGSTSHDVLMPGYLISQREAAALSLVSGTVVEAELSRYQGPWRCLRLP